MIDASAAASLAAGPGQTAPGDFWIGWRRQIDALASAGFRVIVPDQRGYDTSDKPKAIREYTLPKLVGDVVAIADALGIGRFHLVGHDWGGIVAWAAGAKLPHRLERLVILNAPHPEVLLAHSLRSPTQFLRSSYAAFFQFPLLPEAVLGAGHSALLARALIKSSRTDAFTAEEIAEYRQAWERPGGADRHAQLVSGAALPPRPEAADHDTDPCTVGDAGPSSGIWPGRAQSGPLQRSGPADVREADALGTARRGQRGECRASGVPGRLRCRSVLQVA
ncbi:MULTISPECIES: alpha/beta hydrolase [unclassified Mesorhizobium]|uniref:alpha/beta hydrolase n=1 Tax=unclassified Mesorhizobium TaxID=325217 RepID=UPI00333B8F50